MAEPYNFKELEPAWRERWVEQELWRAPDTSDRPKSYVLDMFPYPSGEGLHVGHVKGYIATDAYARFMIAQGYTVLHPMGWDAFGLPAENYALKHKVHPRVAVEKNIARFKEQLSHLGFTYDWEREITTTDPAYYRWTQWIFVQLFKKGLAYESHEPINWCPSCKTGLANEDVEDGRCERCGTPVVKKRLRQWVLKITEYADRLLADIDDLQWPESIKESQRNWIGRKEGINITYEVDGAAEKIICFTTRPDTNFGATFIVLAPEHPFAQKIVQENAEVQAYVETALNKSELDRQTEGLAKTGVFTNYYALNNLTDEKMPIWISDFVLGGFGTGAVVGVPGHDGRDFEFATTFGIPIKRVVVGPDGDTSPITGVAQVQEAAGTMINSSFLDGMDIHEATQKITEYLEAQGWGKRAVTYRLQDWVFSRQRYWGEPIPLIRCELCGVVPVPEEQLPVTLPEVEYYEPTGTGESPLAGIEEWVNVECPNCGGAAKRETNTMPQWAGSSWYYLRYLSPKYDEALVNSAAEKYWMPVDMYVGGAEHATRHLIYARFWHKFLHDSEVVSTSEPFHQLKNVGLIMGEDGRKMSKRWGNVVNPDDVVAEYGADTLRVYEMFMGPFEAQAAWTTSAIAGAHRFLKRVWALVTTHAVAGEAELPNDSTVVLHRTIKRVTESTQEFRFNTAIAALMELLNALEKLPAVPASVLKVYVQLLAPYAPHIADELWQRLNGEGPVVRAAWPAYDAAVLAAATVSLPVQVNGRVRGNLTVEQDLEQTAAEEMARSLPNVVRHLEGKDITRIVYVPGRMINFVTR